MNSNVSEAELLALRNVDVTSKRHGQPLRFTELTVHGRDYKQATFDLSPSLTEATPGSSRFRSRLFERDLVPISRVVARERPIQVT